MYHPWDNISSNTFIVFFGILTQFEPNIHLYKYLYCFNGKIKQTKKIYLSFIIHEIFFQEGSPLTFIVKKTLILSKFY